MRQQHFHALVDRRKMRVRNRYGDCLKDTGTLNRVLMESTGGGLGVTHIVSFQRAAMWQQHNWQVVQRESRSSFLPNYKSVRIAH